MFHVATLKQKLFIIHTYIWNNLKIMNLKRGVEIDHCHKKEGNEVEIMHLPALSYLSNG